MSGHISPVRTYVAVFVALIVCTGLTYWTALIDLGALNVLVALTIACFKALLVILYFMHVKYSSRLTWVFALAGFFWFMIMIAFTMGDFVSRTWL